MRRFAVAAIASMLLVTGLAGAATMSSEADRRGPLYAVFSGGQDGSFLASVDPASLRPAPSPRLSLDRSRPIDRSPDGRHVLLTTDAAAPSLQVVELTEMKRIATVRLASGGRIRAAAWLTADRVVALVQRTRGSGNVVAGRELVVVDPFAGSVVTRHDFPSREGVLESADAAGELVLMLGRADRQGRALTVASVGSDGSVRTAPVRLATPQRARRLFPALVLDPAGTRAFVLAAGNPVREVELATMEVAVRPVTARWRPPILTPRAAETRSVQASWIEPGLLAMSGYDSVASAGRERTTGSGLVVVDTANWAARVIDPTAGDFAYSAGTLLIHGMLREESRYGRRPGYINSQTIVGRGVTAYNLNGGRLYWLHQSKWASVQAVRDRFSVTLSDRRRPLPQPAGVYEVQSGRLVRPGSARMQVLKEPQEGEPARAPSSASAPVIEVDGDAAAFVGSARDDVTRIVLVIADGRELELPVGNGRFEYRADTPEGHARALRAYTGDALAATISLDAVAPVCGGASGPCGAAVADPSRSFALFSSTAGIRFAQIDPSTLEPLKEVALSTDAGPHALSADSSLAAIGHTRSGRVRIFDTTTMRERSAIDLGGAGSQIRALYWLDADRLAVIVQRFKRRDRRAVSERQLLIVDTEAVRVIARGHIPIGLAIVGMQTAGNRIVLLLRNSNGRGTGVTLVVTDAAARIRKRQIPLPTLSGVLPQVQLTVDEATSRAFVFAWRHRLGALPVRVVDLNTLGLRSRVITVRSFDFEPPSIYGTIAQAFGEHGVLLSGPFVPVIRGEKHAVAAGTFLLDTRTFVVRQLDARADRFAVSADRLFTFGNTLRGGRLQGIGLTAYDTSGRRLYRMYGTRRFARLVVAGDYGHLLNESGDHVVVDLERGRSLGSRSAPQANVEVLVPAEPTTPARKPSARSGGTSGSAAAPPTSTAGANDPFNRVSNRGTRVPAKANGPGEREHTPRELFLLRKDEGRAVYRVGGIRPGFRSCYAGGPANAIGRLGVTVCGRSGSPGFPSRAQPLLDLSSYGQDRGEKRPHLLRLEGIAADAVAEVGLLDSGGEVVQRVEVVENVYLLAAPHAAATTVAAFDRQGRLVHRTDRQARPRRQRPASPRRLAGFRIRLTLPQGWSGEIRRSGAGPGRALVLAGNGLPASNARSVSFALDELDPGTQPAFPRVSAPPRLTPRDVRSRGRRGDVKRGFTYKGRQFELQISFAASPPPPAVLAQVNGILRSLYVGAIAVARTTSPTDPPLQQARDDGVGVAVHRSGLVIFRFDTASSLYRRLLASRLSLGCLSFDSVAPWEPNEWSTSRKSLAETVSIMINDSARPQPPYATLDPATEPGPPFDGCFVSGSHGRRWNDQRGVRAPAEIAFTGVGRRFFDERAVARDLALFVRSPKLSALRRALKRGDDAPSGAVVRSGLPARVVALREQSQLPGAGEIGVWTDRAKRVVVSARAPSGGRLFISSLDGRIARHNLEGLAFVF